MKSFEVLLVELISLQVLGCMIVLSVEAGIISHVAEFIANNNQNVRISEGNSSGLSNMLTFVRISSRL